MNRWVGLVVLLACAAAIPEEGLAQAFPSRPIRIIAPFPPGGVSDLLARLLGEEFRKSLGQPVVMRTSPARAR
jgi:tripartite-type tricarboxylate transporter receptor subunit TctC